MDKYDDPLLTVEDVCSLLQVASTFVYRHAREMGVLKVGSHLRFRRGDVVAWLETRRPQAVPEVPLARWQAHPRPSSRRKGKHRL